MFCVPRSRLPPLQLLLQLPWQQTLPLCFDSVDLEAAAALAPAAAYLLQLLPRFYAEVDQSDGELRWRNVQTLVLADADTM